MSSSSPYVLRIDPNFLANPASRLEIREFAKSKERLTVLVRALTNIQARPASQPNSYARIASIHGCAVPFEGFDPAPNDDLRFLGYCQHGSQHFGPWHRPYIMMLEQALYAEAQVVAKEFSSNPKVQEAAKTFRFPFWDWGLPVSSTDGTWIPKIITDRQVEILKPDGTPTTVPNPLAGFTLTQADAQLLEIPASQRATIRRSDRAAPNLRTRLTVLLKNARSYPCMSNHSAQASLRCSQTVNIESLHDRIHGAVGGNGGSMSSVELAAFDPAFWLHHCNVDRLLAFWEGIYPMEKYREGLLEQPGIGSSNPEDSPPVPISSTDPFYPFRKTPTDWWNARDVMGTYGPTGAGTRRLGYFYPEFKSPSVTPQQLLAQVDALYNDDPNARRVFLNLPAIDTSQVKGSFNLKVGVEPDTAPAPGTRALPMPAVHAGTVCLFKRVHRSKCDNCSRQSPLQRANLDITDALAKVQKDAPGSWNNLKLHLEIVPLTGVPPPAGTKISVGDATIFTVVNGIITSSTSLDPTAAAGTGTGAAREVPQTRSSAAAGAPADADLPTIRLSGLEATVKATSTT